MKNLQKRRRAGTINMFIFLFGLRQQKIGIRHFQFNPCRPTLREQEIKKGCINSNALRFNTAPRLRILLTLLKTLLEPFRRTILSSPAIFRNEALLLRFSNIHILKLWRHWFIFSIHSWNAQHLCICVNVNKVGLHVATNTLGANNRPKFTR